jgi:hypothetical protein
MRPNWDIYTQVFTSKRKLQKIFEDIKPCIHIKGHQNKKKAIEELPWPSQLNCRCDTLATEILLSYAEPELDVMYPLPACPAYLICNGTYITSKSIKYIEDLTNEQPLHEYHKQRYGWTEQTFRDIDWDAFRTARRLKTTSKTFTTKLCYKGLATLKRLHKIKERDSPLCIHCNATEEQAHVFQCPYRSEWKKTYIKNLRKHLKKYDTAPSLKVAILAGCTTWINAKPNKHTYDPQAAIGWEAFHYGFIAAEWQHKQAEHYRTHKPTTDEQEIESDEEHAIEIEIEDDKPRKKKIVRTGPVWSAKLIEFLWINLKAAWKERCDKLHDRDGILAKKRRREEAIAKVKALYELRPLLSVADRPILDSKSLFYRINQKTHQMEQWYDTNVKVIHYCVQQQKERLEKGNRDIREFFKRIEQDTDDDISDTDSTSAPPDDHSTASSVNSNANSINPTDLPEAPPLVTTATTHVPTRLQIPQSINHDTSKPTIPRYQVDSDSDQESEDDSNDSENEENNTSEKHQSTVPTIFRRITNKQDESSSSSDSSTQSKTSQSYKSTESDQESQTTYSKSSYQPSKPSETTCHSPKRSNTSTKRVSSSRNPPARPSLCICPSSTAKHASKTTRLNSSSNLISPRVQDPCSPTTTPRSTARPRPLRSSTKNSKRSPLRNQNAVALKRHQTKKPMTPTRPTKRPKWHKPPAMSPEELTRYQHKKRRLETLVAHRKQRKTNDISIFDLYDQMDQSNI